MKGLCTVECPLRLFVQSATRRQKYDEAGIETLASFNCFDAGWRKTFLGVLIRYIYYLVQVRSNYDDIGALSAMDCLATIAKFKFGDSESTA